MTPCMFVNTVYDALEFYPGRDFCLVITFYDIETVKTANSGFHVCSNIYSCKWKVSVGFVLDKRDIFRALIEQKPDVIPRRMYYVKLLCDISSNHPGRTSFNNYMSNIKQISRV